MVDPNKSGMAGLLLAAAPINRSGITPRFDPDPNKSWFCWAAADPKISADELTVLTCPAGLKNGSSGCGSGVELDPDRFSRISTDGLVQATDGLGVGPPDPLNPRSRRSVSLAGRANEIDSARSFGGRGGALE